MVNRTKAIQMNYSSEIFKKRRTKAKAMHTSIYAVHPIDTEEVSNSQQQRKKMNRKITRETKRRKERKNSDRKTIVYAIQMRTAEQTAGVIKLNESC